MAYVVFECHLLKEVVRNFTLDPLGTVSKQIQGGSI